jgi:hypothetical protein
MQNSSLLVLDSGVVDYRLSLVSRSLRLRTALAHGFNIHSQYLLLYNGNAGRKSEHQFQWKLMSKDTVVAMVDKKFTHFCTWS